MALLGDARHVTAVRAAIAARVSVSGIPRRRRDAGGGTTLGDLRVNVMAAMDALGVRSGALPFACPTRGRLKRVA